MDGRIYPSVRLSSSPQTADTKEGITIMRNRITKRFAMLAILCVLIMALAAPALAASYSRVYGQTQDRIRVRAGASSGATILDNIVKGACVYVTDSKTSGGDTYLKVNYRNSDGNISIGWVRMADGNETYVKILSADQAQKTFSVKNGNLPSKRVGTFTAAQRNAAAAGTSTASKGSSVDTNTIKSVQTMLKELKYYSGEVTGNVGSKTETAIKQFQKEYDLTADGVAGPKTVAKLEAVYNDKYGSASSSGSSGSGLRLGSTGEKVRNLQQDLTTLGYYWADITGSFGAKTQTAVKSFQQKNGLTADGVAGTKTLNAIASAIDRKGGTSAGSSYASGTSLKLNSQGSAVTQLQTDLKQLGYYYADITGNFGEKTEAAVKDFQKDKGLYADGVAGGKTLDAIEAAIKAAGGSSTSSTTGLKLGATGEKVRQLQQDLTALGYYYGDISGHYGSLTQAAVKKFQKAKGIGQDGIAGTSTINAIAAALGSSGSSSGSTSVREGDKNSTVLELQTMLKELSYYYGDLTGSYGTLTKRAVRQFQDDHDLTVDGVAGPKTLAMLRSLTGRTSSDSSSATGSITSSSVAEANSYFLINQDNVRLRTTYSLSSAAKTTMDDGHPVQATRKYNVGGTTWYYITVRKNSGVYSGYVRAKVLTSVTRETFISNGGNVNLDTAGGEILGMIRITANSVSIRETASSSSTKMGTANKGDVFHYINTVDNWFQIQSGYWIKKDYVAVMTESEVDSYIGSGSYAGGTYREGDRGSMVQWIQEALDELDYYSGELSGHYGSKTKEAVRKFQRDHDLSADGVAGPKTIAKIMESLNNSTIGSGTVTLDKTKAIFNIPWTTMKSKNVIGNTLTLTDIGKNVSFKVKVQSTGNHADVEPVTANDTKVLCSLYGVATSSQLETQNKYQRRVVIATNSEGKQFIGSIYAIPHGLDTVSGNDFDGQFCLHFKDSTVHSGGGSISDSQNHQAKISSAAASLKASGYTILTEYP
ncbi:MAG: peptidoglycan-binding protein [Clostridia bacterium]|nr:peptidoglycan-binding protein [Clostridia bacterium]